MPIPTFSSLKIGKVYTLNLRSTIFASEYEDEIFELWRQRGSFATEYGEFIVKKAWPFLIKKANNESYDFEFPIGEEESIKIEMKTFTSTGCSLLPSAQVGAGRTRDDILLEHRMKTTLYLLCDIVSTPALRFVLLKGADLYKNYPKGIIKFSDRAIIFDSRQEEEDIASAPNTYRSFIQVQNEQFYTKEEVVTQCLNFLTAQRIGSFDLVIDPSAGAGAFSQKLKSLSKRLIAFDIQPNGDEIQVQDYRKYLHPSDKEKVLVVGTPPFGRQSSLAKCFIKKSVEFADVIAFILPRSLKKESLIKCFDGFDKEGEIELASNSFFLRRGDEIIEHSVPSVFQIWKRDSSLSSAPTPQRVPAGQKWNLISRNKLDPTFDEKDKIFIHRLGTKAGKAFSNKEQIINPQGKIKDGYFIVTSSLITSDNRDLIVKKINEIEWQSQRSISQLEIIPYLDAIFDLF